MVITTILTDFVKISPLISTLVVIITFTISQIITTQSRNNELRRSWYFKAYFDVSVKKVDDFFDKCIEEIKISLKALEPVVDENDRLTITSKSLEKISDDLRDFKVRVLQPLAGAYPEVFKNITIILDSFYDIHSSAFDKHPEGVDPFKVYLEEVATIKNNLMTILAVPVLKNKQSRLLRKQITKLNPIPETINYGKIFGFFIGIIVLGSLVCIFLDFSNNGSKFKANREKALLIAQSSISSKLISPSTASFSMEYSKEVKKLNDYVYFVNSYVDSQNKYGAIIRTYFTCKVTFDNVTGDSKCENLVHSENL